MTTDFYLRKCDFIETLRSLTQKQVALELLDKISIVHIAAHVESNSGNRILAPPNRSHTQPYSFVPKPESYTILQKVRVIRKTRVFHEAEVEACSVLATLWSINDTATREFMENLYQELCEETSVCEALRRTNNIFQQHEKQRLQSFEIWAPFTVYGEDDVKFDKEGIEKTTEEPSTFLTV